MRDFLKIINGSFLVAGTCIGGGMLALPVLCARVGLFPSFLVMLGVWIFMSATALIYLECTTWMKEDAHLMSMASHLLGPIGKKVCWSVFVFICYGSLVAYLSTGGRMLADFLSDSYGWGEWTGLSPYLLYLGIFGGLLFLGTQIVGSINAVFFFLVIVLFIVMVSGAWSVDHSLLARQDWELTGLVSLVPLLLTAFSFPGIVPVIASFHKGDVKKVKSSILTGTILTMSIYAIWIFIVLGNVPWEGDFGLSSAFAQDRHACDSLVHFLKDPSIGVLAQAFAFFAVTTSFLGLAMGLSHFLSDGFDISGSTLPGKTAIFLLITIPVLGIKIQFGDVFFKALDMTGGIGDSVVSGMIPALMLWTGRYRKGLDGPYRFCGGKTTLTVIIVLSILMISYELFMLLL